VVVERSPYDSSLADLLRDLARQVASLVRQEIALVRAEMAEKAGRVVRNLAALVVGAVVAMCGGVFVLLAASQAVVLGLLAAGVPSAAARAVGPLLVGSLTMAVAWALVRRALHRLAREPIVPVRTARTLAEEKQWLSEKLT
jgi:hypothetical protein